MKNEERDRSAWWYADPNFSYQQNFVLAEKRMPPAARTADSTTHGTPLAPGPGSVNVIIGGMPAWRAMVDQHACPAVSVTGADGVGSVMMGSPTVMINYQMACRMGDIVVEKPGLALGPANPIVMGCPTVIIGESGGGAPGPQSAALLSAAQSGTPFCEECEKAREAMASQS